MHITLNDHTGISISGELVDHKQWVVMCDGVHVGYLQKDEGSWLQCIVFMDEATKSELVDAVCTAAKMKIGGAVLPVDPDYLPNVDEQGEDDDE